MRVTIFDYGAGNLHSLAKAVAAAGAEVGDRDATRRAASTPTCWCCPASARSRRRPSGSPPGREAMRDALARRAALPRHLSRHAAAVRRERRRARAKGSGVIPGRVTRLRARACRRSAGTRSRTRGDPLLRARGARDGVLREQLRLPARRRRRRDRVEHARGRSLSRGGASRRRTVGVQFHPEKSSRAGRAVPARVSRGGVAPSASDRDSGGGPARRRVRAARSAATTTRERVRLEDPRRASRATWARTASRGSTSSISTRRRAGARTPRSSATSCRRRRPRRCRSAAACASARAIERLLDAGARARDRRHARASRSRTGSPSWPRALPGRDRRRRRRARAAGRDARLGAHAAARHPRRRRGAQRAPARRRARDRGASRRADAGHRPAADGGRGRGVDVPGVSRRAASRRMRRSAGARRTAASPAP